MASSQNLRNTVRNLRRQKTNVETKLWMRLRDRQLCEAKFRRQHPIDPYIVDFCCPDRELIIELDGGQHADQIAADRVRTAFLEAYDYRVVRFWNHQVLDQMERFWKK